MRIKKRVFVGLLTGSLFLLFIVTGVLLYADASWHNLYYPHLIILLYIAVICFFCLIALGIGGIVLTIIYGRSIPFLEQFTRLPIHLLFPFAVWLGKLFDIEKEAVERSFIEVNNQLVRARLNRLQMKRVLMLLPHCLQQANCPHKITYRLENCERCGGCAVDGLLAIKERYPIQMAIVTGGTLARQVVKNVRPNLIIAVACERDLTSGIQDCYPIPVIGILNKRPEGPCFNTCVELAAIENVCKTLFEGENIGND